MKPLNVLVHLWTTNKSPVVPQENNYLLKILASTTCGAPVTFYVIIEWCGYSKTYLAEPVDVLSDQHLKKTELPFDSHGVTKITTTLNRLGIKEQNIKGIIDVTTARDYRQQLADIHPALVPKD